MKMTTCAYNEYKELFNYDPKHACTIGDVEESKACAGVISPRILSAETLHVIIRPDGFLYGGVFTR